MSSDLAMRVRELGKCYQLYDKPQDRLKQSLWRGRKRFYQEFWALRGITFDIRDGDTIGIIGRNGSGKSTLLQIVAGTLAPTTGEVHTRGRIAALLELGSGFNPEFTGRENVYLNGVIHGIGHREMDRRFPEIAEFAGIGEFIDMPVKTYSSGMIVRLAFSVSVHVDADILILDEALAVGDAAFQFKCVERMERLTRSGTTLLFVSHDITMVRTFCQRVIYLHAGEVRAAGGAEEVTEMYALDLRDEQRKSMTGQGLTWRETAPGSGKLSFGSGDGRVVRAAFGDTGGERSQVRLGEPVRLRVELEYRESLKSPTMSVIVQDRRLFAILGRHFPLGPGREEDGTLRNTVECSFRAALAPGAYHVTIRLEDRLPDGRPLIVDKQVGLLSFEVSAAGRLDFLGVVDLDMECVEVDPEGGSPPAPEEGDEPAAQGSPVAAPATTRGGSASGD